MTMAQYSYAFGIGSPVILATDDDDTGKRAVVYGFSYYAGDVVYECVVDDGRKWLLWRQSHRRGLTRTQLQAPARQRDNGRRGDEWY